jgi:hypothetical protein
LNQIQGGKAQASNFDARKAPDRRSDGAFLLEKVTDTFLGLLLEKVTDTFFRRKKGNPK